MMVRKTLAEVSLQNLSVKKILRETLKISSNYTYIYKYHLLIKESFNEQNLWSLKQMLKNC